MLLFVLSTYVACSIYSLHHRAQVNFNKGQVERPGWGVGGILDDEMAHGFSFSFTNPSFLKCNHQFDFSEKQNGNSV